MRVAAVAYHTKDPIDILMSERRIIYVMYVILLIAVALLILYIKS